MPSTCVDIDEILGSLKGWSLSLKLDNRISEIEKPSVATASALERLLDREKLEASSRRDLERLISPLLRGFDIADWGLEMLVAIAAAIVVRRRQVINENGGVSRMVLEAMRQGKAPPVAVVQEATNAPETESRSTAQGKFKFTIKTPTGEVVRNFNSFAEIMEFEKSVDFERSSYSNIEIVRH